MKIDELLETEMKRFGEPVELYRKQAIINLVRKYGDVADNIFMDKNPSIFFEDWYNHLNKILQNIII